MPPPSEPEEELHRLAREIAEHDHRYHREARPTISDFAYDQLRMRYEELRQTNLFPTSAVKVGDDRVDRFRKVAHGEPMLSLNNTYGRDELHHFVERVEQAAGGPVEFIVEPKIDGVALAITYHNGSLFHALTRGNGIEGDDVTANVQTVAEIPKKIFLQEGEVRGEIYLAEQDFLALNAEREEAGDEPYANARNLAAGSLKLLDPRQAARRRLRFLAYDIVGAAVSTQWDVLQTLRRLGFPTNDGFLAKFFDEIWRHIEFLNVERTRRAFGTDGAVVKVNDRTLRTTLGAQSSAPRWAIAYKFAPKRATTVLENIQLRVGRTGIVTPVAVLTPVSLAGSLIGSATLHNGDDIARKDLRIGDTVFLEKAGEVIPAVVGVAMERRPVDAVPYVFPANCPACGARLVRIEGEVARRCLNSNCPPQLARRLEHFAAKTAMDIATLGPARIGQLMERGLVRNFTDIYSLDEAVLAQLPGMGPRSAKNLLAAIAASKGQPPWRLLHGLGIPHVGAQTAKLLLHHWHTLHAIAAADEEALRHCDGIGEIVAASIFRFFHDAANLCLLKNLSTLGLTLAEAQSAPQPMSRFFGKSFAITGSFEFMGRDELRRHIEGCGGVVREALSKQVNVLLVGDGPGSKLARAEEFGIEIVDAATLRSWMQDKTHSPQSNTIP
ncbi:MAG: NAD-dependent DNA ligase LigA [Puniceicoccales bacterium]|jgi:DNA ligase (NAD+)|nr:NAD-dependent DNA ligase LigA [Puniceicoccales bacterium]